jgi:hypothetical protein
MAVEFWNNVVLFVNGLVAMAEACCCTPTPTPSPTPTGTGPSPTIGPTPTPPPTSAPGDCYCRHTFEVVWDCDADPPGWGSVEKIETECVDICTPDADWAFAWQFGNQCGYWMSTCEGTCDCPPTPTPPLPTGTPTPTVPPTGVPTLPPVPTPTPTPSMTPTPTPEPCGDCSGCDSAYGIFISGLTGTFSGGKVDPCDCTATDFAGTGVTKGSGCNWGENSALSPDCFYAMSPALHYSLWCAGSLWYVKVWQAMPASNIATFSAPNVDGCPPVNGWTQVSGSCTGGTCTVF